MVERAVRVELGELRVAIEGAMFGVLCRRWGVSLIEGASRSPRLIGTSRRFRCF